MSRTIFVAVLFCAVSASASAQTREVRYIDVPPFDTVIDPPPFTVRITPPPIPVGVVKALTGDAPGLTAAIALAEPGDEVIVPPGTWTITETVDVAGVTLKAEVPGTVTLIHEAGASPALRLHRTPSAPTMVVNLFFRSGSSMSADAAFIQNDGPGKFSSTHRPILIAHNDFLTNGKVGRSILNRLVGGVIIYQNTFEATSGTDQGITVKCETDDCDASWTTPSTWGTQDVTGLANIYIEDNIFRNYISNAILDADSNARVVVRHNTLLHSHISSHGADSSQDGVRHVEVYRNEFTFTNDGKCSSPSVTPNLNWFVYIRGGSWRIWENTMPNIKSCIYGDKSEIVLAIHNLRRKGGPYGCWSGGYPAPHQVGQGYNGPEPLYIWGNVGGAKEEPGLQNYNPDQCGGGPGIAGFVQPERDYILGPAPDYEPYQYPHPLRK